MAEESVGVGFDVQTTMTPNTEQLEALEVDFDRWWNNGKARTGVQRACPCVTEADAKWIAWIAWLSCHEKMTARKNQ